MRGVQFLIVLLLAAIGLLIWPSNGALAAFVLALALVLFIPIVRRRGVTKHAPGISVEYFGPPEVSSKVKRNLLPIGNTKPVCPSCNARLDTKPGRKKRCPRCGQYIFVRTRPSDKQRVLVTQAQADQIEEQWSIVNGTNDEYVAKKNRFAQEKGELARQFGREPSDDDVRWSLLNRELIEHARSQNWGLFRNGKHDMAEICRRQGKLNDALALYFEVCYLDLNGPNNTGGATDPKILKILPPWNPKEGVLSPWILDRAARIIEKTKMEPESVRELFVNRANLLRQALRLRVQPDKAWRGISEAIFS